MNKIFKFLILTSFGVICCSELSRVIAQRNARLSKIPPAIAQYNDEKCRHFFEDTEIKQSSQLGKQREKIIQLNQEFLRALNQQARLSILEEKGELEGLLAKPLVENYHRNPKLEINGFWKTECIMELLKAPPPETIAKEFGKQLSWLVEKLQVNVADSDIRWYKIQFNNEVDGLFKRFLLANAKDSTWPENHWSSYNRTVDMLKERATDYLWFALVDDEKQKKEDYEEFANLKKQYKQEELTTSAEQKELTTSTEDETVETPVTTQENADSSITHPEPTGPTNQNLFSKIYNFFKSNKSISIFTASVISLLSGYGIWKKLRRSH